MDSVSANGLGKYPKRTRKVISIIAVFALVLTLLPAVPAMAGQVGNVSVTADNLKAGATGVNYTVAFNATSGLQPGDEIVVTFPTGYDVTNATVRGITYDGTTYQPAGTPTQLGSIFRVGVPAELTVPAGGNVAVEFTGVKNPTTAGSYKFAVRTTVDTTTAYGSITIEPDVAAKIVITEPQSGTEFVTNQVVPIKLAIQDQHGNLTTLSSDLTVTFTLTETTDNGSAKLYSDPAATKELTDKKLVIAAGNTGGTAYLKDTEAEDVTIGVTNTGSLTNPDSTKITIKLPAKSTYKLTQTGLAPSYAARRLVDVTGKSQSEINAAVESAIQGLTPIQVTLATDVLGQDGYEAVRILPVGAGDHIQLWAKDTANNWYDINKVGWGPPTGFPLPAQYSATTDVYLLADAPGNYTLKPQLVDVKTGEVIAEATGMVQIIPGTNDHFVVSVADAYPTTEDVVEINSGQRTAVTIEAQDECGNPVPQATNLEVSLSTTSDTGNAKFYSDVTSDTPVDKVTIPAGASSVTVYYYDKLKEGVQKSITITATAGTLTGSAPVTLVGPRPDKLEVVGDDSVEVNLRLPLTIKLLDQYGNPYAVAQETTVDLTDKKGGEFYTSLIGGNKVDSVTIAKGASEATVYYRPTSVGTNMVAATAHVDVQGTPGFDVQGTKTVTVRPAGQVANELSITAEPIKAGTTGAVTVKVTDQYGNPVAQSADLVVTLKADSPTGKFYDKAQGGNEISTVTIKQGESEAMVYYYDTKAGQQKITVSAPGLDPAEGTINVAPAEPVKIAVEADGSVMVNERAKIMFAVADQFDNPVVVDGSSLTLVLSSSSTTGRFEDESGKQITQVTITAGQSSAIAYYRDSTAGEVTITAKTTGLEGSAKLTVQSVPAPDTTPPTVEGTDPQDKATGVAVDKTITVTFSEDVQQGDSFGQIALRDVAGKPVDCNVALSGNTLTIDPHTDLDYNAKYTVIIPAGAVQDLAGNALAEDYTFSFTTGLPMVALKAGWNLVSLPLIPNDPKIDSVLAEVYSNLDKVWAYDAATGSWSYYKPGMQSSTLTEMRDGRGYWVKVTADCSFAVDGVVLPLPPQVPPSYELVPGWNLIGFKSTVPKKASEYLAAMAGKYTVIYGYDAATQRFYQVLADDNLQPGQGYWIAVTAQGRIYP